MDNALEKLRKISDKLYNIEHQKKMLLKELIKMRDNCGDNNIRHTIGNRIYYFTD